MIKRARTIRNKRKRIVLGVCYPDAVEVIGSTHKTGPQDVLLFAAHESVHPSWMRKYRIVLERIDAVRQSGLPSGSSPLKGEDKGEGD